MKPVIKYLLFLLVLVLIVGALFKITRPHLASPTEPETIPTYEEVVPKDLSALGVNRVLDPTDAGPLLEPRLDIVKVSDQITGRACANKERVCDVKALYTWTKRSVTHTEVLPTRDHIIGPEETLLYKEGDDTTMSILLAALLRAQGFDAIVGVTPYTAFTQTKIDGETIRLDPGCGNCAFASTRYDGPEDKITWIE